MSKLSLTDWIKLINSVEIGEAISLCPTELCRVFMYLDCKWLVYYKKHFIKTLKRSVFESWTGLHRESTTLKMTHNVLVTQKWETWSQSKSTGYIHSPSDPIKPITKWTRLKKNHTKRAYSDGMQIQSLIKFRVVFVK